MAEFVSGYRDGYGKIHSSKEEAQKIDDDLELHQKLYKIFTKLPMYPRPEEVGEFVLREYEGIKTLMEKYGR
mgnify:CR=1 FL=1